MPPLASSSGTASSTVGVVPIKSKGEYIGKVDKLGTVRTTIN